MLVLLLQACRMIPNALRGTMADICPFCRVVTAVHSVAPRLPLYYCDPFQRLAAHSVLRLIAHMIVSSVVLNLVTSPSFRVSLTLSLHT